MNDKKELEEKRRQWIHETQVYLAEKLGPDWPHDSRLRPKTKPGTTVAAHGSSGDAMPNSDGCVEAGSGIPPAGYGPAGPTG